MRIRFVFAAFLFWTVSLHAAVNDQRN